MMQNSHKTGPSNEIHASLGSSRHSRPMDPREAAEYLSLDEKTVTRWARKGYIQAHPLVEGKRKFWRFLEHELVDWLNSQTNGGGRS
jgi:excisionase family DNA binding protein